MSTISLASCEPSQLSSSEGSLQLTQTDLYNYLYEQNKVQPVSEDEIRNERQRTFWCELCKVESVSLCTQHGSLHCTVKQSNSQEVSTAIKSFPNEVQLCRSSIPGTTFGVVSRCYIPKGTWLGPYEGVKVRPDTVRLGTTASFMWEIYKEGRLSFYLDGSNEDTSSWMRFIGCARNSREQNLYAFQYCGNIYYRAFKEIPPGTELLVWYDDMYPQFLGIPLEIRETEGIYQRAIDPNKSNEVVVVVTSAQDGGSLTLKDHIHQSSTTLSQQPLTVTSSEPLLIVDQRSYIKTQPMVTQPQATNIIARKNLATDFMASAMAITAMTTNVMATTAMATNAMATNAMATNAMATNAMATNAMATNAMVTTAMATSYMATKPIATVSMEKNALGTNSIEHISISTVPIASHSMEKAYQPMKKFPTERSPKILVNHRRYNSSSPIATHSARRTPPNSLHSIPLTPMSAHSTTSSMTPTNLLENANTMPRSVEYAAFALRQSSQQTLSEPEASEILLRRQKGRNSKSFKTDAPSLFVGQGATTSPNQGRKRSYSDSIEAPRSKSVDTSPKDGNAFKCGQCGKTFPQRSVLQIHVCPKQPYKPYHCGHCNRLFDDPNELRNHAMIHSNEKPFKCGYCSRSFSGATTLNNHIRTHTGEKPFECSLCGKTFSQASQLSRHEKIPGDCI